MVSCANVKAKTLTLIMYTKHTGIVGEWADAKVGGVWVGGVNSVKTIEHAVEGVFPQVLTCKKNKQKTRSKKNVKRCKPEREREETHSWVSVKLSVTPPLVSYL